MVRHKNRYLVVELSEAEKASKYLPLRATALHEAILDSVQKLHGDFGIAAIRSGFTSKYCNEITKIGVIRARHGPHRLVASAIPCIKSVDKNSVSVNVLYMGATIKHCFMFVQKYQQRKFDEYCVGLSEGEKSEMRDLLNVDSVIEHLKK